ncbi:MAG: two-component system, cell cycle response regulator [Chloroflexia bacterium]|jgi:diguanylate cyclase (GGDEF)-like protein|nr:two-component system, cell cycle response regulator [Chloroflexia bacterium]
MFKEIAEILTHNIDEITRRWVEGLRQSQRTEVQNHMLTAEIVDGMKAMLANLAQAVEGSEAPEHETLPLFLISGADSSTPPDPKTRKPRGTRPLSGPFSWALTAAASQGKQRHTQEYELHEVLLEWIMLRQIAWDVLRVEMAVKELAISVEFVQYFDRLLDELALSSLENYYNASVRDLEKRAIHDPLTQLYNKDYFRQRLNEELRRAVRYSEPLTVAMIDMDGLKPINDTFGHPVGDAVIQAVGFAIRNSSRQPDVPCRYGGDEFAVILPETNKVQARVMTERILRALQNNSVVVTQTGQALASDIQAADKTEALTTTNLPLMVPVPTVSIGLASFPDDARNPEMLIAKADAALYQAKRAGRNRIFAAGEALPKKDAPREDTAQDE